MRVPVVLVVFLLLTAGCSAGGTSLVGPSGGNGTTPTAEAASDSSAPADSSSAEPAESINPWGHETVTVAVRDDFGAFDGEDFRPSIRSALDYWNSRENASFPVTYELTDDARTADVVVNVNPRVETCAGRRASYSFDYCSRLLSERSTVDSQVTVSMTGRYGANETARIAKRLFSGLSGADGAERYHEPDPNGTPWPWQSTVTIGVTDETGGDRDYRPFVDETLAYWVAHDEEYGDYATDFEFRPNASNPDVEIRIVESILQCGVHTPIDGRFTGCASLLDGDAVAKHTEVVEISYDQSDESIVTTMKHEFGHLYGIEHGEEPMPLMNASFRGETLPRPNATERDLPWRSNTLTVYVDDTNVSKYDRDEVRREVRGATDYYESGADGYVPDNLTFEFVSNESVADVTVVFLDSFGDGSGGSDVRVYGRDTDGDGALEHYTSGTIRVADIEDDRVGWHVGTHFGYLLGLDTVDDLPPPFDNPRRDDRDDWN